jgi:prevent-host-death family protein
MSEIIYDLHEAKPSLSQLVDHAANGEEIILSKAGKPLAKLVPYHRPSEPRQPGGWEGQIRIAEDFDAPPASRDPGCIRGARVTPASRLLLDTSSGADEWILPTHRPTNLRRLVS